jgi:hypothetical protein
VRKIGSDRDDSGEPRRPATARGNNTLQVESRAAFAQPFLTLLVSGDNLIDFSLACLGRTRSAGE